MRILYCREDEILYFVQYKLQSLCEHISVRAVKVDADDRNAGYLYIAAHFVFVQG